MTKQSVSSAIRCPSIESSRTARSYRRPAEPPVPSISSGAVTAAATGADLQHTVLETWSDARNYNAWLADVVRPHLGDDPIEIGAGIGTFSQLWLDRGVPRLTVTEVNDTALASLEERFAGDERVCVEGLD